jgi:hypothetical protein
MLKTLLSASVVALALAGGAQASGKPTPETDAKIRATLTEQGYEVAKIEMDDGLYEAYARKDGSRYEVYLNAEMEIVKIEKDD